MTQNQNADPHKEEITQLVRQLSEIEQRLQTLTDGQLDAVVDPESGTPIILRQAQEELRKSQARLRLLLEHLPAVVWTTDADLRVTSISGSKLSTVGWDAEQAIGDPVHELVQAESDDPPVLSAHQRALQGEEASYEMKLNGRTYECSVEPLRANGEDVNGCVGLALDITRRVEAEEELRQARDELEKRVEERTAKLSEAYEELQVTEEEIRQQNEELIAARRQLENERQRYEELFQFAPDGYLVTDPDGIIREANRAAAMLLGIEERSLTGKPLLLFVADEDREEFHTHLNRLPDVRRVEDWQLRLEPRNGVPFHASVNVAARDSDGEAEALRWSVRDISNWIHAKERQRALLAETEAQRERAEASARKAQRANSLLRTLIDTMPVGVMIADHEGSILMVNTAGETILGQPVSGTLDEPEKGHNLCWPDGSEVKPEKFPLQRAVQDGTTTRDREFVVRRADGKERTILVGAAPVYDEAERITSAVATFQDITPRKRAEEALRESEEKFRTLADFTYDWEYWLNKDGEYIYTSPSCERITGYPPSAFRENPRLLQKIVYAEDRSAVDAHFSDEEQETEAQSLDFRIITKDGETRWLNHACRVIHDEDGECLGWRGSNRDITERKQVERERERLLEKTMNDRQRIKQLSEALRQERDTLQAIMDNTHAQLAYLDPEFNFVRVNAAYAKGSGYSKEELVGRNHFELFHHDENEAIFKQVRDTGEPIFFNAKPFENPNRPELGTTYWDWSLVPVKGEDGEVRGLVFSLLDVTERERLMVELEAERARLDAIIHNAPEGIVVADGEARVVLTNPAADEIYARPVPYWEDFESHADLQLCYPDGTPYDPRDLPLTRAALDGESTTGLEIAIVHPEGDRRELLVDAVPIQGGQGEIDGAIGIFRDITERKEMEQAIRQYADQLTILHEIDHAILAAQTAEEIADVTLSRLEKLVPHRVGTVEIFDLEAKQATLLAVRTEEEFTLEGEIKNDLVWREPIEELQMGRTFVVEDIDSAPSNTLTENLRQQGIRSFASVPLTAEGTLIGSLNLGRERPGTLTDDELRVVDDLADQLAIGIQQARLRTQIEHHADMLEQRVQTRTAQLRASEARFRAIFEQTAIGIALLDREGKVVASNPALRQILGHAEEELRGRTLTDFAHPNAEIEDDIDVYREIREGAQDTHRVELRYEGKDRAGWANMVLSLVRGPEGHPQFVIAMVEDITERKQAQAALIQSEKLAMSGKLAASLAHEVNNPLQTVIGCLGLAKEVMTEEEGEGERVEQYVDMAHEELKRAARIVGRLRDLNRPVEEAKREPTDVNEVVRRVLQLGEKRLVNEQIDVIERMTDDLPHPNLAADRIQQVFLNLMLNAADAMSRGGRLLVTTCLDTETGEVCVAFEDTGVGIPSDILDDLFDPFFTTKSDGLGLGLFVSQGIVEQHGGRIEIESREGVGSTFTVRLPVDETSDDEDEDRL